MWLGFFSLFSIVSVLIDILFALFPDFILHKTFSHLLYIYISSILLPNKLTTYC